MLLACFPYRTTISPRPCPRLLGDKALLGVGALLFSLAFVPNVFADEGEAVEAAQGGEPSGQEEQGTGGVNMCGPTEKVDKYRYLRQLSLDLRGEPPSYEEYKSLDALEDVDPAFIRAMMDDFRFDRTVNEFHRRRMRGNFANIFVGIARALTPHKDNPADPNEIPRYYQPESSQPTRGVPFMPCANRPAAVVAGQAPVQLTPNTTFAGCATARGGQGCVQDGWVEVRPEWDPNITLRVCAFDAQAKEIAANGQRCGESRFTINNNPDCGCGPGLRHCTIAGPPASQGFYMTEAILREPLKIFEHVIRERRSYIEAFTTRLSFANGPLVTYINNFAEPTIIADQSLPLSHRSGVLPSLPRGGQTGDQWFSVWEPYNRGEGHSGVLTTPFFLYRFNTDRSRANHFFTEFLCSPFESNGDLPDPQDECNQNPNLSERCGCANCHGGDLGVEAVSRHWGRWQNVRAAGYLEPDQFPTFLPRCATCTNNDADPANNCDYFCDTYYMTRDNATAPTEARWHGYTKASAWTGEPGQEPASVQGGPAALVAAPGVRDRIAQCTVSKVAEEFLHRTLSSDERANMLPELSKQFRESGYDYKELLFHVVQHPVYRTIR